MKKIIGPDDSTQEYKVPVEDQKKRSKRKETNNKRPKNKKSRTKDWSFYAIIISLILLIIPTVFFGITLYRAYSETGNPVIGHRFDNDLKPKITSEDLSSLEDSFQDIEGVDGVDVQLQTATLRVYLDMGESDKEAHKKATESAKEIIYESLNPEEYFTAFDSQLQYDYELYAHNELGEEMTIYLLNKTSRMEKEHGQYLSDPVSAEMVEELWEIQDRRDNPEEEVPAETEAAEEGENE